MAHQVRGFLSFEYLSLGEQSPPLRRKRKSEDLRYEYGSDDSDGARSPPTVSSPFSSKNAGSPDSAHGYTTSVTMSSDISSFDRALIDFICVCGNACSFSPGELVVCAACGEWLSVEFGGESAEGAGVLDKGNIPHPTYSGSNSGISMN